MEKQKMFWTYRLTNSYTIFNKIENLEIDSWATFLNYYLQSTYHNILYLTLTIWSLEI